MNLFESSILFVNMCLHRYLASAQLYLILFFNTQVPRLFPTIKKIYNTDSSRGNGHVFLALLQFFTNHSKAVVYDPEPVFRTFFETYLANNCTPSRIIL